MYFLTNYAAIKPSPWNNKDNFPKYNWTLIENTPVSEMVNKITIRQKDTTLKQKFVFFIWPSDLEPSKWQLLLRSFWWIWCQWLKLIVSYLLSHVVSLLLPKYHMWKWWTAWPIEFLSLLELSNLTYRSKI